MVASTTSATACRCLRDGPITTCAGQRRNTVTLRPNSRFQCYAKPETILKDFWHDLGTAMVMASIELGVRADPSLELISFDDIRRSPRMPAATRAEPDATAIPVSFTFPSGKCQVIIIRPDWPPFGIGRGGKYFFCCDRVRQRDRAASAPQYGTFLDRPEVP